MVGRSDSPHSKCTARRESRSASTVIQVLLPDGVPAVNEQAAGALLRFVLQEERMRRIRGEESLQRPS